MAVGGMTDAHIITGDARVVLAELPDLAGAWIDPGPSPAGNPGPYLKARRLGPDRTVHRIYPRRPGAQPELRDGVWWWVW